MKIVFEAAGDKMAISNVDDRKLDCSFHSIRADGEHSEEGEIGEREFHIGWIGQ